MSIALLNQVYDEARRLAIAGSSVATGDFRLKKLLQPLEQAGAKSPVFAKLAVGVKSVVESDSKSVDLALLELGTLINSILYTQGESSLDGPLEPMRSIPMGLSKTQTPAKLLQPLLEALTKTGSGRFEIIREAASQGLFRDLRLIRPALMALDDSYSEISQFVASEVLPIYGSAVFPELELQFDPKGKGAQSHRLLLMHRIDALQARPYVLKALDEGSKETRVAAISCLGTSDEDLAFLLENTKAKAKDVRTAALTGLARLELDAATVPLIAALDDKELDAAVVPLQIAKSPKVVEAIQNRVRHMRDVLLGRTTAEIPMAAPAKKGTKVAEATVAPAAKGKATKTVEEKSKEFDRFSQLLQCLKERTDAASEDLLSELMRDIQVWEKIPSGGHAVVNQLAYSMSHGSNRLKKELCDLHEQLDEDSIGWVFRAACEIWKPPAVFDAFAPSVRAAAMAAKAGKDPLVRKGAVLIGNICSVANHSRTYRQTGEGLVPEEYRWADKLSNRWLDLAIECEHEAMILSLAHMDPEKTREPLTSMYKRHMAHKKEDAAIVSVLDVMVHTRHPQAVDAVVELIEKRSDKSHYFFYWICRLIPFLPPDEAIPRLEAIIPKLPDRVSREILEQIFILKQNGTR